MCKWIQLISASTFLISCVHKPALNTPTRARTPAAVDFYKNPEISEEQNLTYDKFHTVIMNKKVFKVEDVVRVLGKKYPDYLKLRTAMCQSDSLQAGSFAEPRIVVFGAAAKFIFAFNGGPHQLGGAGIEMAVYNDADGSFAFRELSFKQELGQRRPSYVDASEIEYEDSRIILSAENPEKCLECHGFMVTAPIWETYSFWPGAYGSNDDLLYGSFVRRSVIQEETGYDRHGMMTYLNDLTYPRSQGRVVDLANPKVDRERDGFLSYLAGKANHSRYKYLPPQSFENGFMQYIAGVKAESIDASDATIAEGNYYNIYDVDRLNSLFLNELAKIYQKALLKEMQSRDLATKWSTINWKMFYGSSGADYPFVEVDFKNFGKLFEQAVGQERVAALSKKTGMSFETYARQVFKDEIDMQLQKIVRMEKNLGTLQHTKADNSGSRSYLDIFDIYASMKKNRMNEHALGIVMHTESDGLPIIAVLGYLLKGEDIDLSAYALNRQRAATFYDAGLNQIAEYLKLPGKL